MSSNGEDGMQHAASQVAETGWPLRRGLGVRAVVVIDAGNRWSGRNGEFDVAAALRTWNAKCLTHNIH